MNATAYINAGVCGFITNVSVDCKNLQKTTRIEIETECEKIKKVSNLIQEVIPIKEVSAGFDGKIMSEARKVLDGCCSGCVVPPGIFKTVQVAARLALPKDVEIKISV